jgi:hypothetical protein
MADGKTAEVERASDTEIANRETPAGATWSALHEAAATKSAPAKEPDPEEVEDEDPDEPEGETDDEADKEEAEDKPKPAAKGFDKSIQPILQAHANERKARDAQIATLTQTVNTLQTQLATRAEGPKADPQADKDSDDLKAAQDALEAIDDSSSPADVAKATRNLLRVVERVKSRPDGAPALPKAVLDEIVSLRRQVNQVKGDREFNDFLDRMDAAHGAQHRNKAVQEASRIFEDEGFTAEDPPPVSAVRAVIRSVYERLKAKPGKANPSPSGGPSADPGRGGRSPGAQKPAKSMSEALRRVGGMKWQYGQSDET